MAVESSRYIVGIDLGTTHTVVAFVDTAKLPALPKDQEALIDRAKAPVEVFAVDQLIAPGEVEARPLLHSLRYHPAQEELRGDDLLLPFRVSEVEGAPAGIVGQLARELGAKVPGRLVPSAKSWLSHPSVDRTAAILPWGAPKEVPKISPVDASASYLAHLRAAWNHAHPKHPLETQSVVLTVPASFDEGARALTLQASRTAGLGRVRLLEEPQAAFYDWLARRGEQLEEEVAEMRLALVVDVGGGTTDLTLIQVELRESGPRLTRIAVGDHLMLGGDNMDLALAHDAEGRLGGTKKLGSARFTQLIQQCRSAKERLLAEDAPEEVKVTVLGKGSRLIGGSRSAALRREEAERRVLDGFFPVVEASARPEKKRGAIVEFGLPYVADPAVTRHVAAFLARHADVAREALGDRAPEDPAALPVPDAVLLNGGVFRGHSLSQRLLEVLEGWRGEPLRRLENSSPELAVARGAVSYGLARRGIGVRIGGGSARSYFLLIDEKKGAEGGEGERGICVLPRGAEEGEEIQLKGRTFSLRLGEPVRFRLASSTGEVVHHRPGDLVEIKESFRALPPIAAVLEGKAGEKGSSLPVHLVTALTEVGTIEMSSVAADDPSRRWKLEFQLRGGGSEQVATTTVKQLHPRFQQATDLIRNAYGRSQKDVEGKKVIKTLRASLEKTLGPRQGWDTPLLRELFGALLAGIKRRRRSPDHERVWFNLAGFCLRPGFGYPLDPWRVEQLWEVYDQNVQFAPEAQNWAEFWILWRRVAGGLKAEAQGKILDDISYYLEPPSRRGRKRPSGPKYLGYDDMVRLAASLEHLPPERKVELGKWLITRLKKLGEGPYHWWAVGRLGVRVPFYGSAHNVVPKGTAEQWLEQVLALDWAEVEPAAFAATVLARMSGDRQRDIDEALRAKVVARLRASGAPESWVSMVREVTELGDEDERRIFGESLPAGLTLLED